MEGFDDGVSFVRLRCCTRRGKYLAADIDGRHVCLSGQSGVHNAVWAVEHVDGPDGPCVLLRGAYGRYLLASDLQADTGPAHGVIVAQVDLFCSPPPPGTMWRAVRRKEGAFVVRSNTGRYLRANGRFLRWRRAVTAAGDNGSTMMQWAIESVPIRMTRPCILDPIYQLKHLRRPPPTESEVAREIRYARGDENGDVDEDAWQAMQLHTHNLMQLRLTLACCMGASRDVTRTTLCVRAGYYAQLSPLLVDLPLGNNRIDVVILKHGTPADDELRYPDLNPPAAVEDTSSKEILQK